MKNGNNQNYKLNFKQFKYSYINKNRILCYGICVTAHVAMIGHTFQCLKFHLILEDDPAGWLSNQSHPNPHLLADLKALTISNLANSKRSTSW